MIDHNRSTPLHQAKSKNMSIRPEAQLNLAASSSASPTLTKATLPPSQPLSLHN